LQAFPRTWRDIFWNRRKRVQRQTFLKSRNFSQRTTTF
jgi:hypothetical protein